MVDRFLDEQPPERPAPAGDGMDRQREPVREAMDRALELAREGALRSAAEPDGSTGTPTLLGSRLHTVTGSRESALSAARCTAAALVLVFSLMGAPAHAEDEHDPLVEARRIEDAFGNVLANVVEDGRVDYAALKEDPGPLDDWIEDVAKIDWAVVRSWPPNHARAFYINAYNGHVLRIVRDHYPIDGDYDPEAPSSSILQIPNVWSSEFQVAGQDVSLDRIEKEILMRDYANHRIHFALVCASVGCPPLKNEAFHGDDLGFELDLASQIYVRSPHGAQLDMNARVLRLSRIFDWYREDFHPIAGIPFELTERFGDLAQAIAFVATLRPRAEVGFIQAGDFSVEFIPWDWSLNDQNAAESEAVEPEGSEGE